MVHATNPLLMKCEIVFGLFYNGPFAGFGEKQPPFSSKKYESKKTKLQIASNSLKVEKP